MIVEVAEEVFKNYFPNDPHPFNSSHFLKLNKSKAEKILYLVEEEEKPEIGLVIGVRDSKLISPFSAPFGGFHFKKENMYSHKVDAFVVALKEYFIKSGYKELRIALPPDIYFQSFNAKCVSALFREGYCLEIPEITSYIELDSFNDRYKQKNSREYYRQAERNELIFKHTVDEKDISEGYNLISENRAKFGRPIYMTLDDILNTGKLWPVDFFKVTTPKGEIIASAIFYRFHQEIVYAVFWGDNDLGRPLRAMDYMILNLWSYYKKLGFKYIDLGISTEDGVPNAGLLRFKETHEAVSSIRYRYSLKRIK